MGCACEMTGSIGAGLRQVLTSVGIDIGTSTTQLIFSRITIVNMANAISVPRIEILNTEVFYKSPIYFTPLINDLDIDADGVKIYPDENGVFNIPTDAKKVTIYPYIFTYRLMNPKVTYYLEGFDREQMVIKRSDLTSIDYTNLRGGKYTFRMIISDSMGHENNEFAISIVKKRAVYEMLWFYLLIFVVQVY